MPIRQPKTEASIDYDPVWRGSSQLIEDLRLDVVQARFPVGTLGSQAISSCDSFPFRINKFNSCPLVKSIVN